MEEYAFDEIETSSSSPKKYKLWRVDFMIDLSPYQLTEDFVSKLKKFLRLIEAHRFKLYSIDATAHMEGTFHKESLYNGLLKSGFIEKGPSSHLIMEKD